MGLPHFAPKARRVIYLFQSGAPSHIDLFDYKPKLKEFHGTELPDSVRRGQRVTEMTHKQKSFPCVSSIFKFKQHGDSGAWLSEILPHTGSIVDEMAFRMQTSVPKLMDLSHEPKSVFDLYGPKSRTPGTYAANCLLARRLAERGVRFIQLFHRGWDQHGNLPNQIRGQCADVDQASAALIKDLKTRGLLDETLVVWGGEFGRTVYAQGKLTKDNYGRDHHGRCFTVWMAGGGIQGGVQHGRTDDYCYNVVEDSVRIRDLNATILHCLGIDHEKLTFKFQGLDHRLTGVESATVVKQILA